MWRASIPQQRRVELVGCVVLRASTQPGKLAVSDLLLAHAWRLLLLLGCANHLMRAKFCHLTVVIELVQLVIILRDASHYVLIAARRRVGLLCCNSSCGSCLEAVAAADLLRNVVAGAETGRSFRFTGH